MTKHAELLLLAKRGNKEAFGKVVRAFQDWAVGYAYSILGDFTAAEDAAQEAFIDAYVHFDDLRDPQAFPLWFRRIVFTNCTRHTRVKRLSTVPLEEAHQVASLRPGPPEAAETQETRRAVLDAVRALPENERSVATLFCINEHSYRQIGEFLDVPVSTVKFRLYSARKRLKERLIDMVKDDLQARRPSRNDEFVGKVARGLRGVYVDETHTSHIDGEAPMLLYRGFNIDDLARKASFEETAYLLLHGTLPNNRQLADFSGRLRANRTLPAEVVRMIRDAKEGHPIDVLRTAVSMLASFDADAGDTSPAATLRQGIRLTAAAPTIVAAPSRISEGEKPVTPRADLGHASNFLFMLFGEEQESEDAKLVDRAFTLHAAHGLNASTLAAVESQEVV